MRLIYLLLSFSVFQISYAASSEPVCASYLNSICAEDHWTSCDENLVHEYTRLLYLPLNRHLRGLKSESSCELVSDALKESLGKLPPLEQKTVYRGVVVRDGLATIKEGECFTDFGFISTSTNKEAVKQFAFSGSGAKGILELKSKTGKDVSQYSAFKGESEILFLPKTIFILEKKDQESYFTVFKFKETTKEKCSVIIH